MKLSHMLTYNLMLRVILDVIQVKKKHYHQLVIIKKYSKSLKTMKTKQKVQVQEGLKMMIKTKRKKMVKKERKVRKNLT